ncbi:MAG: DUF5906 domain-containing protein, partial [Candidatus Thorarchaeota archaeon]
GFDKNMNKNPMIFGVGNGVLELHHDGRIKLIQEYHHHKISAYTPVRYKPFDPEEPMVKYLLSKIRNMFLDDCEDSFNWFMHWLGSTFDGQRKTQLLLILWGLGNNGKSLITNLYNHTFDEMYCTPLPSELLTRVSRGAENATPVLMAIKDKRLVIFSEIAQKETINTQILKRLLGAEKISARELYRLMQQFEPICCYVMLCNSKPDIPSPEEATWKRLRLINLPFRFYLKNSSMYDPTDPFIKEADPKLENIHENPEAKEAFLSIVSFYWQSLQVNYGGKLANVPCPNITKDTEQYRMEQDTITNFINMRLVTTTTGTKTYMSEIIELYRRWFESKFRMSNQLHRKDMTESFKNSKLGKYLKEDRRGYYIENMRFLAPKGEKDPFEKYKFPVKFGNEEDNHQNEDTKDEDTKDEDTKDEDTKDEDTKDEDTKDEDTKDEDTKDEEDNHQNEDTKDEDTKDEEDNHQNEDTKDEDNHQDNKNKKKENRRKIEQEKIAHQKMITNNTLKIIYNEYIKIEQYLKITLQKEINLEDIKIREEKRKEEMKKNILKYQEHQKMLRECRIQKNEYFLDNANDEETDEEKNKETDEEDSDEEDQYSDEFDSIPEFEDVGFDDISDAD